MKIIFISVCSLYFYSCPAQQIVRAFMANEKGITWDQKRAKYLIVVKKYEHNVYERLDYNFSGSMITQRTYTDSGLSVLNGRYADYSEAGYLASDGQYYENKKDGDWMAYDDTSHAILKYTYHLDTLLSVTNLDSLQKARNKVQEDTTGQVDAVYEGGNAKISKIVRSNLKIPDRMTALSKSGTVIIRFVVDTVGHPVQIEVLKSVEFSFDEESKRVVALLKDWLPASNKGLKVKAYRLQPITVTSE